ncbi:hypothetical protein [Burkholderia sp. LMG 32019]|uniref:hypothetical protein n=1 Tax=Burkholderia sp. LMG 32019 TaxID=3158173 RepID=UPI003C305DC6
MEYLSDTLDLPMSNESGLRRTVIVVIRHLQSTVSAFALHGRSMPDTHELSIS